jgi:uncharacterized protein DUF4154
MEFLSVPRAARMRAARAVVLALGACASALAAPRAAAQADGVEYAVKATYLYKFAPFVEWPASAFASPAEPFVLCVAGADRVTELVEDAVRGQAVARRPIVVRHLATVTAEAHCHILYVALRGAAAVAALERVRGTPVLTVTDAASDPRAQGIVNFVIDDNRVRFEIDLGAAADNQLVVSSKLAALALRVRARS